MGRPAASHVSAGGLPDWTDGPAYGGLLSADRSAFAWEWLRRTERYRRAWHASFAAAVDAHQFHLERLEDPFLGVPRARPVWSAAIDPMVIMAKVQSVLEPRSDCIDLLDWRQLVTLVIDDDHIEHLLLSDGAHAVRIDIIEGTLIGCPAGLLYLLEGVDRLRGPLSAINRLILLCRSGRLHKPASRPNKLPRRWILELRVADALATGADQHEIARVLYGDIVSPQQWQFAGNPYRLRIQRLARTVRGRLATPLDPFWFDMRP